MQRVRKTLLARVEEQSIQHVDRASFGMEGTSKHHLLELIHYFKCTQYNTIQSAVHGRFIGKRCITAMTRSSPICAEPYACMVHKHHIAEGTDFDAEQRAQEMWALLYSPTHTIFMVWVNNCIEETILRIANSFNPMWKYSTMQRA